MSQASTEVPVYVPPTDRPAARTDDTARYVARYHLRGEFGWIGSLVLVLILVGVLDGGRFMLYGLLAVGVVAVEITRARSLLPWAYAMESVLEEQTWQQRPARVYTVAGRQARVVVGRRCYRLLATPKGGYRVLAMAARVSIVATSDGKYAAIQIAGLTCVLPAVATELPGGAKAMPGGGVDLGLPAGGDRSVYVQLVGNHRISAVGRAALAMVLMVAFWTFITMRVVSISSWHWWAFVVVSSLLLIVGWPGFTYLRAMRELRLTFAGPWVAVDVEIKAAFCTERETYELIGRVRSANQWRGVHVKSSSYDLYRNVQETGVLWVAGGPRKGAVAVGLPGYPLTTTARIC